MANLFEETVVDFDLNFLQPVHNVNYSKHEKQRQSIVNIKNKIIKSHCLVQKYYLQKDRLEETESLLLASKEECKQACLDYKVTLEKCLQLEKEALKITDINRELEQKLNHLDNQCEAMKSHALQLQSLVKEQESIIQALNLEKQLEKNTVKESEKKLYMLEKERKIYLKDIKCMRDAILSKKKSKSCKNILNKYKKLLNSEDKPESDKSDDDSCFEDSPLGSPLNEVDNKQEICISDKIVKSGTAKSENNNLITDKDNNDNDSDCCNEEVVSEDTGRGSSLAFFDADKFLNSPEMGYCIADRHQKIINKKIIIHVDVGTSPIRVEENIVHPNKCDDEVLMSKSNTTESPEYFITDFPLSTEVVTIKEKKQLLDASTSPIPQHFYMKDNSTSPIPQHFYMKDNSTSPISFENCMKNHTDNFDCLDKNDHTIQEDTDTKPNYVSTTTCHMNSDNLSRGSEIQISTDLPEINSLVETKNNASDDTDNDLEVETILNSMRLRHTLISPIPKTPKKLHKDIKTLKDQNPGHIECPDALKMKEENKALHANIGFLCKEIILIKKILNTKMPNNLEMVQNSNLENILDESIQETLTLGNNKQRQCGSDVYHNYSRNSGMSALSKLVDIGPINIDNIDQQQWDEQTETSNLNGDEEPGACNKVEINKAVKKHTHNKEYCKEVSADNLLIRNNTDSHNRNKKDIQTKKQLQPTIKDNVCRNHKNAVITGDDDDESHNPYLCENLPDNSNQLSNVGDMNNEEVGCYDHEEEITENGVQNSQDYNPMDNGCDKQFVSDLTDQFERIDEICNAVTKPHKLTKLDKFKKKIMPKCKISRLSPPSIRKLKKRKQVIPISDLNQRSAPSQILNNKDAYDKALKVMTEIKLKTKDEKNKTLHRPNGKLLISSQSEASIKYGSKNSQETETRQEILQKGDKYNLRPLSPVNQQPVSTPSFEELNMSTTDHCIHKEYNESPPDNNINKTSNYDNNEVNCKKITSRCINMEENPKDTNKDNKNECDTQMKTKSPKISRRRKRVDSFESNISCKRMLRSSNVEKIEIEKLDIKDKLRSNNVIDYNDLDVFSTNIESTVEKENVLTERMGNNVDNVNNKQMFNTKSNSQHKRRPKRLSSNISDANSLLHSSNSDIVNNVDKDHKNQNVQVDDKQGKYYTNNESYKEDNHLLMNKVSISSKESTPQGSNGNTKKSEERTNTMSNTDHESHVGNSILCKMIVKYGKTIIRHSAIKVSDNLVNSICKKIENSISNIIELSPGSEKIPEAINELVEDMKNFNMKSLLAGLMKYLQDPARKLELYNKVNCHPSMAMTKREQIILSALQKLNTAEFNIVNDLLRNIEFTLFRLNKTPEFDTIESLAHFYAVTCRLFHMKYRLKTFLLDAMYCLQYKAVIIVKQCLITWTHILPLAHMKYAKSPLITCIVYLLHFYKCEDRFNRVQNIRWILNKKYFFTFSEWNETKILEMFGNAIKYVKVDPAENNMLRLALLIFGKRHGPKWCQRNVINNMLLPMIEDEKIPEKAKIFCIKLLGPLLKPYPGDMKVHCEIIVNQLLDMLDHENLTHGIKEAIITSLIYMSKHNPSRVTKVLLSWHPERISLELENLLKTYVREKPIKAWKTILSKTYT